jgi:hypothetical protein
LDNHFHSSLDLNRTYFDMSATTVTIAPGVTVGKISVRDLRVLRDRSETKHVLSMGS